MKRIFAIILAMIFCLCLTACGDETNDLGNLNQNSGNQTTPAAIKPSGFSKDDIAVVISGQTFGADTKTADVLALLGESYEYEEAMSCAYSKINGVDTGYMDKTYDYGDTVIKSVPPEGEHMIADFYTERTDIKTTKGIGVGSTIEEVEAAYGPIGDEFGQITYKAGADISSTPGLYFMYENGVVYGFGFTSGLSSY